MKYTRSEFLGLGTGLIVGTGLSHKVGHGQSRNEATFKADLVLLNGSIYTLEPNHPRASAFAVSNGRFMAVGDSADVKGLIGRETEVIDAEGGIVVPGFIDAHTHPSDTGVDELVYVDCSATRIADIQSAMRKKASSIPAGEWVVGFKYDDTKLQDGRPINRLDLDTAVPDHPAVVGHRGGHTSIYNSKAFELAGVTAETASPEGGKYYVENGELTGLTAEKADETMRRLIPSESTREQRRDGLVFISKKMAAAGLTSVQDAGVGSDGIIAYQDAYHSGEMSFRACLMILGSSPAFQGLKSAGIRTGFGNEWLRIGNAKYFSDGSASERTMRMSTPYIGRPNDYGILTMSQEEIHEAVEDAHRHGYQVGIHANGDVAIDMVLKAYERVQKKWPREDPRHRIEHCTLVNPDLLKRIKATGSIPTPFYTYVYFHGGKWANYGEEKLRWMFAHRSFLDYGIPVASASDYVPGPYEPLMAIQSMVTRKDYRGKVWGANQRVSVDEALRICTMNAARASFEEHLKGSIKSGKLADFVVLSDDPHDVEPDQIKDIKVLRTVVGGRTTFSQG